MIDFSVVKEVLCEWLETEWDHKMLLWENDPMLPALRAVDPSVVSLSFNPTAENLAAHLINVGNVLLEGKSVEVTAVKIEETRKCSAEVLC